MVQVKYIHQELWLAVIAPGTQKAGLIGDKLVRLSSKDECTWEAEKPGGGRDPMVGRSDYGLLWVAWEDVPFAPY